MSLARILSVASLVTTLACGGGKGANEPAQPAAEKVDEAAKVGAAEEIALPPVTDPEEELRSLEAPAMEMTRGGGGDGASRGGRDYANQANSACEDGCEKQAGDIQNSGSPQYGANKTGACYAKCAKQAALRDKFLKCDKSPEECRSNFQTGWQNQDKK